MANVTPVNWENVTSLPGRGYVCGHCGKTIGQDRGYYADYGVHPNLLHIYLFLLPQAHFLRQSRAGPRGCFRQ